jgi:hypothetical protein
MSSSRNETFGRACTFEITGLQTMLLTDNYDYTKICKRSRARCVVQFIQCRVFVSFASWHRIQSRCAGGALRSLASLWRERLRKRASKTCCAAGWLLHQPMQEAEYILKR